MAINFPNDPIDGNTYEFANVRYLYVDLGSNTGFWKTITTDSGPATATQINDGTDSDTYATPVSLEGSKYNDALNYLVPTGLITMWYGATTNMPTGWVLCDGGNGTPDLRDRFVVGAGNRWGAGTTGGSHNAVVVSHNHGAYSNAAGNHNHTGTTSSNGNHRHYANTSTAGNHNHSGDTGADVGSHSHGHQVIGGAGNGGYPMRGYSNDYYSSLHDRTTESAGGHGHSLSINYNGNHNHSLYTDYPGNHNHTFTTSTAGNHSHGVGVYTTGESGTDKNIPLFYALAYIMKT